MSNSLADKRVLVLGLGLHGGAIGTIQWLAQQGAIIAVSDTKTKEALQVSLDKLIDVPNITYFFGNQDDLNLDEIDMIVRNPGVPRTSPILQRARTRSIPVEMDSSLFFEYSISKNIIGITGSKGKTTASSAISAVMKAMNADTVTVGVDGVSPMGALTTPTRTPLTPASGLGPLPERERGATVPIVFELSSWRLEPLQEKHISPHIAVITSLYKDHLNTYASYEEYIDTKKQIIADQAKDDIAILNADDAILKTWKNDVRGNLFWFSIEKLGENERGIWVERGKIFVNVIPASEPESKSTRQHSGQAWIPGQARDDNYSIEICSVSEIPHTSPHELRNKLPAILIGILFGVDTALIVRALQNAPVLNHRLQFVRTLDGVRYVNDTTATMPDATIAAIESMGDKPIILILGGNDKALEFENLAKTIASHKNITCLIWLPGTATDQMKHTIHARTNAAKFDSRSMNEAVQHAHQYAKAGDTVLLSPGALSFGLFLHEFDRGDAFIHAVEQL